jgi:hypothetical protein
MSPRTLQRIPLLLLPMLLAGCQTSNERLGQLATENAQRQAEQNRSMADLNRSVSQVTQRLIEEQGASRQQLGQIQQQLDAQQLRLAERSDALEQERLALARQRTRDPIIAAAILEMTFVLLASLPLILCGWVVKGPHAPDDVRLGELLALELAAEHSALVERPQPQCLIRPSPTLEHY